MRYSYMDDLKAEAHEACAARGHDMGLWERTRDVEARSKCLKCPGVVYVNTKPMPNDTDIVGDAVALNCPIKNDEPEPRVFNSMNQSAHINPFQY